jgi:hypothetical protein
MTVAMEEMEAAEVEVEAAIAGVTARTGVAANVAPFDPTCVA